MHEFAGVALAAEDAHRVADGPRWVASSIFLPPLSSDSTFLPVMHQFRVDTGVPAASTANIGRPSCDIPHASSGSPTVNIAGVAVVASRERCMLLQVNGCRCRMIHPKQLLLGDSLQLPKDTVDRRRQNQHFTACSMEQLPITHQLTHEALQGRLLLPALQTHVGLSGAKCWQQPHSALQRFAWR
jgi:hypothetical protein